MQLSSEVKHRSALFLGHDTRYSVSFGCQFLDGKRFYSGYCRDSAVWAEKEFIFCFLFRVVSVKSACPLLQKLPLLHVIECHVADHVGLLSVLIVEFETICLSHSMPSDLRKVANIDSIEIN